jgi:uncharacterized membrane protein YfcA
MTGSRVSSSSLALSDRLGVWASVLCVGHCLLTPVLLSMSTVLVHVLPSDESVHRTLAACIACIGAAALVRGVRMHRRFEVLYLMAAGLACIFFAAFCGNHLPGHWAEVGVTFLGSLLMICAHRRNHTFCGRCSCTGIPCEGAEEPSFR